MLRIGTCSWKYDSWVGILYSTLDKTEYLAAYSKKFDTVEVDQWFWSLFPGTPPKLPAEETVKQYATAVPDNFLFSIKVPNSLTLTHYYKKYTKGELKANPYFLSVDLFEAFLEKLELMGGKTGPLIFQFEYLNKQKMPAQQIFLSKLEEFITHVPRNIPVAIEIRNPNYLNEQYFRFLETHGISHVFTEGYYMPPVTGIYGKYKKYINKQTVIRLLGGNRTVIEKLTGGKWNKTVLPQDENLKQITKMLQELLERQIDVFVNVNNHYEGSAPLTINKILTYLK